MCGCNYQTVGFDRKVAGAVRVRSGEGEMKCWGISGEGKPNGVNPACAVRRAVLWPTSLDYQLKRGGSTGQTRVSAPALPLSHFQESEVVLYHGTVQCGTSTRYQRTQDGHRAGAKEEDGGDGGDRSVLAALNKC